MDGMTEHATLGEVLALVDELYTNDIGELVAACSKPPAKSGDEGHDQLPPPCFAVASPHHSQEDAIARCSKDSDSLVSPLQQSSSCSKPSTSQSAVVSVVATSKTKKRRVVVQQTDSASPRHRKRGQQDELAYLQATVLTLEKKLKLLTLRANAHPIHHNNRNQARTKSVGDGLLSGNNSPSNWEDIASRQLALRYSAECENTELRDFVKEQIKIAKSLEKILSKPTNRKLLSSGRSLSKLLAAKRERWQMEVHLMKYPLATDHLHAELIGMYEQIPRIFGNPRFQSADNAHRAVKVRNDPTSGKWIEFLDARVLPFVFETIGNTQWEISKWLDEPSGRSFIKVEESDNTIIKIFEGKIDFLATSAVCRIQIINRRFVDADQTAILSFLRVDPISASGTAMEGVTLQRHAWQVIRPMEDPRSQCGEQPASTFNTYQAWKPVVHDESWDRELKITTLANFVRDMVHLPLDSSYQELENRLMRDMLS